MVVLPRKLYEAALIGRDIIVTVLGKDRGQVKIGIAAPLDITIDRGERLAESRVPGSKERF